MSELKTIVVLPSFTLNQNGQSNRQKIDIGEHYKQLSLRITGNLVVGTASATLKEDGILNLIKSVQIQLSAGQIPVNLTGEFLYRLATINEGVAPSLTQPAVSVGTNAFVMELVVPFSCLNSLIPDFTILNSKKLRNQDNEIFNLEILLGNETDVATAGGGGGTIALSSLACVVSGDILEKESTNQYHPHNAQTMKANRFAIAGAGTFLTAVDLKSGNPLKSIAIISEDSSVLNSNAVIDEIRIRKGVQTYVAQYKWNQLRDIMKRTYGLSSVPDGFALVEIDKEWDFSNMLDTGKENQVYLEVVALAQCYISVASQEILQG